MQAAQASGRNDGDELVRQIEPRTVRGDRGIQSGRLLCQRHIAGQPLDDAQDRIDRRLSERKAKDDHDLEAQTCSVNRCSGAASGVIIHPASQAPMLLVDLAPWFVREFDGEEGLDAGVEVERFAGPARSDICVGVVEAVDRGQPATWSCC